MAFSRAIGISGISTSTGQGRPGGQWLLAACALVLGYPGIALAQLAPQALSQVTVQATRILSPQLSPGVSNDYRLSSEDITNLPAGDNTVLTDVLAQMPGVGIDQNQQVHIRNTEGSGFQYDINDALVPLDI
ncbi:MAG: hypothetical protein ACREV7_22885, partial [Steroidobacteraceae bacterium]